MSNTNNSRKKSSRSMLDFFTDSVELVLRSFLGLIFSIGLSLLAYSIGSLISSFIGIAFSIISFPLGFLIGFFWLEIKYTLKLIISLFWG